MLAAARAVGEELLSDNRKDSEVWQFLGFAAFLEAEKRLGRQHPWKEMGDRCFREAVSLRPDAGGLILGNWALGLGRLAMSRSGAEAFELYAQANEKCTESEKIDDKSWQGRVNWSAILLREARERGGPPALWESAKEQATQAEAINPGSGAYNLACIAADLHDYDAVHKYLLLSAEYGQIVPLSQILRDVNFEHIRGESWFRTLLDGIFDSDLAPAVE